MTKSDNKRRNATSKKTTRQTRMEIGPVKNQNGPDAEFCDSPGAMLRFGLGRTYLYQLLEQGLIEGVSLRKRGQTKGKRLWNVDSIRSYLNAQMEEQERERK